MCMIGESFSGRGLVQWYEAAAIDTEGFAESMFKSPDPALNSG